MALFSYAMWGKERAFLHFVAGEEREGVLRARKARRSLTLADMFRYPPKQKEGDDEDDEEEEGGRKP